MTVKELSERLGVTPKDVLAAGSKLGLRWATSPEAHLHPLTADELAGFIGQISLRPDGKLLKLAAFDSVARPVPIQPNKCGKTVRQIKDELMLTDPSLKGQRLRAKVNAILREQMEPPPPSIEPIPLDNLPGNNCGIPARELKEALRKVEPELKGQKLTDKVNAVLRGQEPAPLSVFDTKPESDAHPADLVAGLREKFRIHQGLSGSLLEFAVLQGIRNQTNTLNRKSYGDVTGLQGNALKIAHHEYLKQHHELYDFSPLMRVENMAEIQACLKSISPKVECVVDVVAQALIKQDLSPITVFYSAFMASLNRKEDEVTTLRQLGEAKLLFQKNVSDISNLTSTEKQRLACHLTTLSLLPLLSDGEYSKLESQVAWKCISSPKALLTSELAFQFRREAANWLSLADETSPLNTQSLMEWYSKITWTPDESWAGGTLFLIGEGPIAKPGLSALLKRYQSRVVSDLKTGFKHSGDKPPVFVLGRNINAKDSALLLRLIRRPSFWLGPDRAYAVRFVESVEEDGFPRTRSMECPLFYSQEMLLYQLFTRRNPHSERSGFLDLHVRNHAGLELLLRNNGFKWVSADIRQGDASHSLDRNHWLKVGYLAYLGYHVGESGLSKEKRRLILRKAFDKPFPENIFPPHYQSQWGAEMSSQRLQKIASSLASFARLAKQRNKSHETPSISDWLEDLEWLQCTAYIGKFDHKFKWPKVD